MVIQSENRFPSNILHFNNYPSTDQYSFPTSFDFKSITLFLIYSIYYCFYQHVCTLHYSIYFTCYIYYTIQYSTVSLLYCTLHYAIMIFCPWYYVPWFYGAWFYGRDLTSVILWRVILWGGSNKLSFSSINETGINHTSSRQIFLFVLQLQWFLN